MAYFCESASFPVLLPDPRMDELPADKCALQSIVLAGGCFWGMEMVFRHVAGVVNVLAGYAGGAPYTAHYESVNLGTTEHAECVKIYYDLSQITLGKILKIFFRSLTIRRKSIIRGRISGSNTAPPYFILPTPSGASPKPISFS